MAEVIINEKLKKEIYKKFKNESVQILEFLYSLENNPHKGKELTQINGVVVKELRYKSFRFYFLVDGYLLKIVDSSGLVNLLIKIIAISDKKGQQKTIEEIKIFLRTFGKDALK